jgi:hypothetical protein
MRSIFVGDALANIGATLRRLVRRAFGNHGLSRSTRARLVISSAPFIA